MAFYDILTSVIGPWWNTEPLYIQNKGEGSLVSYGSDLETGEDEKSDFIIAPNGDIYISFLRNTYRAYKQTGGLGNFDIISQISGTSNPIGPWAAAPNGDIYVSIDTGATRDIWRQPSGSSTFTMLPGNAGVKFGISFCVTSDNTVYAIGVDSLGDPDLYFHNGSSYTQLNIQGSDIYNIRPETLVCSPYTDDLYLAGWDAIGNQRWYKRLSSGGSFTELVYPSTYIQTFCLPAFAPDNSVYIHAYYQNTGEGAIIKQTGGSGPFVVDSGPSMDLNPSYNIGYHTFICTPNNDLYAWTAGGTYKQTGGTGSFEYVWGDTLEMQYREWAPAPGYIGGLVGGGGGTLTVTNSYWDTDTSGQTVSAGGEGKTTSEMKSQDTFLGWDFNNTWHIVESDTYPLLSYIVNFSSDVTSGPPPLTVNFTGTATPRIYDWHWDFGDGGESTDQNPTYIYTSPGLYTVILTVDTEYGFKRSKVGYIEVVSTDIIAYFSGSPLRGNKSLVTQFVDESIGAPTSWYWNFGDGYSSTEQNPIHFYKNPGEYTVSLIITGSLGTSTLTKPGYVIVKSSSTYDIAVSPIRKTFLWGSGKAYKRDFGIEIKRVSGLS